MRHLILTTTFIFLITALGHSQSNNSIDQLRKAKAVLAGKILSKQTIPLSKYEFVTNAIGQVVSTLEKDQFETSEQYLFRKGIISTILDSIYSMQFSEFLSFKKFEYDADKGIMKIHFEGVQPDYCEVSMNVQDAKSLSKIKDVKVIATCMLNTNNELEIVSSNFSINGNIYEAIPNNIFIPHCVKSIVTLDANNSIIENTSDSLVVLSSIESEKQKISVYRISDCSLVNTFKKMITNSWKSKYVEPAKLLVEFTGRKGANVIVIWLTSTVKPLIDIIPKFIYNIAEPSGSNDESRKNLGIYFLNDDSTLVVGDLHHQLYYIYDLINKSEKSIHMQNSSNLKVFESTFDIPEPFTPTFPSSGLFYITITKRGLLNLNVRDGKNELSYKLIRTIPGDTYLDMGEDILLERNGKKYLHNKVSGNENILSNLNQLILTPDILTLGKYLLIPKSPIYSVYDSKEDKIIGYLKVPEGANLFKYGIIKSGSMEGTIHIITYQSMK